MAKTVRELQKVLGQAAKDDKRRRFHSLYDKVSSEVVLWEAWRLSKKKGGRGGVDGKEFSDYEEAELREGFIREIREELLDGTYRPQPVLRTYIQYTVKTITATGFLFFVLVCCQPGSRNEDIAIRFDGGYGQLEIGGKYAGAEFHQSRPLPSRISFYYPVANSINLSTSYWSRQESVPFTVILTIDGRKDTLGLNPQAYRYTPYSAAFEQWVGQLRVTYQYDFCAKSPVMAFQLRLTNESQRTREIKVQTLLNAVLRTSHTYSMRNPASVEYDKIRSTAYVFFDDADTDSALVFVANAGEIPLQNTNDRISNGDDSTNGAVISFTYRQTVESAEQMNVVQLIGSCVQSEKSRVTSEAVRDWQRDVEETRHRLLNYSTKRSTFKVPDSDLQQTLYWAKAMMASNMHYLHGWIVPMPCPAEYNFFFTHDFLVTSLGAGLFDSKYVTNGYRFLSALARRIPFFPMPIIGKMMVTGLRPAVRIIGIISGLY